MCVSVGVHVGVLEWVFMYVCQDGHSCICVRVGVHICVLGWAFMYLC